jgi:hypothetical protein
MRTYIATFATAFLALGAVPTDADAMTTSAPAALGKAMQDITVQEQVHCRPGWTHWHRWGWGTGCSYGYYPRSYGGYGFYGGPSLYVGPRFRGHYRRW